MKTDGEKVGRITRPRRIEAARCCICGKPVPAANVMHGGCWERRVEEAAQIFCDGYCRWPLECGGRDELEAHCDACALIQLGTLRADAERAGRGYRERGDGSA
jgi:hypothetical protein